MEPEYRNRQQRSYTNMRVIYDFAMAMLILGMAVVMFFAPFFKIQEVVELGTTYRYLFGTICLPYGGFRLYRAFKRDY